LVAAPPLCAAGLPPCRLASARRAGDSRQAEPGNGFRAIRSSRARLASARRHSGSPAPLQKFSGPAGRAGFTLIEMMIVMSIIVILVAIAVPFYQKAIIRAKETVLHNNLSAMRNTIDEYTFDKQKAPQSLQDLVTDGYLREVPKDPITGSADTWKIIMEDAGQAVNANEPGIYDVRSGSPLKALDGTSYSDW
jgi:general secretion pathway protein G